MSQKSEENEENFEKDWRNFTTFGENLEDITGELVGLADVIFGWPLITFFLCLIDWLIDSVAHKIQKSLENSKVWYV